MTGLAIYKDIILVTTYDKKEYTSSLSLEEFANKMQNDKFIFFKDQNEGINVYNIKSFVVKKDLTDEAKLKEKQEKYKIDKEERENKIKSDKLNLYISKLNKDKIDEYERKAIIEIRELKANPTPAMVKLRIKMIIRKELW